MNPLSAWTFHRRHKRHAALLLSLSIVVTLGLYSMVALVWAVYVEQPRLSHMALSRFSIVTPASEDAGLDSGVLAQIQANPDVTRVIPTTIIRIEVPGLVPGESFRTELMGLTASDLPLILERLGASLQVGHLPDPGTNGLLLSEDAAAILDVEVGDTYGARSSEFYANLDVPLETTDLEVTGILESEIELGIVPLEFLSGHRLYRNFPARFLIVAQEGREAAVDGFLRDRVQTRTTDVMTLTMLNERILSEALPGFAMLLPIILIVACAFSLVIVAVNQIANARRLPEFGILHATGHSKRWLARRLALETTTLALVGWLLGIGLSWLGLGLLKAALFAPRGYDLSYIPWIPILSSLPVPLMVTGFTYVTVRRTLSRLDPVAVVEQGELSQEVGQKQRRAATASSPKPLSPATFYGRHRRRAALLVGGMSLMILAVVLFPFTLATSTDAQEPFLGYLSRVSVVRSPGSVQSLDPKVVDRLQAHPAVERLIPVAPRNTMLQAAIPPFTGAEASPFGVYADDMAFLVDLYELELSEGHLPHPGTNEMVIPESLAQNRNLEVGDMIGDPAQPAYPGAPSLPTAFVIFGIFAPPGTPEAGSGWGFVSLEFLESSSGLSIPENPSLIVVPREGQKGALDDWLENELSGVDASVLTHRQQVARLQEKAQQDMLGIALLEAILAIVAALVLAVLNYVFCSQRQSEFGVLHALGYSRRQLVGRVVGETTFTTGVAWLLSGFVVLGGMLLLRFVVYAPVGLSFRLLNVSPWLYTLPIPVVVLAVGALTTAWTLSKVDAVSIIERR